MLFTGNDNGPECEVPGYEVVLNVMWMHDLTTNPAWLPCFLRSLLATLAYNGVKQKIDLCGVSRGAQACGTHHPHPLHHTIHPWP